MRLSHSPARLGAPVSIVVLDDERASPLRALEQSASASDIVLSRANDESTTSMQFDCATTPMTPREACTRCRLSMGIGKRGARERFHRAVCSRVTRLRDDHDARERRIFGRACDAPFVRDTLADTLVRVLVPYDRGDGCSVPIDTVAGAIIALASRDAERRVLDALTPDGHVELLLRPYLVERLQTNGLGVHCTDRHEYALIMCLGERNCGVRVDYAYVCAIDRKQRRVSAPSLSLEHIEMSHDLVWSAPTTTHKLSAAYWTARQCVDALDVSYVPIDGASPRALGRAFDALRTVHARHCALNTIDSLGAAHTLHTLVVSDNRLHSLPDALRALAVLTNLVVARNELTTLDPDVVRSLVSLCVFDVSSNRIARLPAPALAALPALKRLDASDNRLVEFPRALTRSHSLRHVSFMRNSVLLPPGEFDALRVALGPSAVVLC